MPNMMLRVRRPSPTTAEFCVSPAPSALSRILRPVLLLARLLLALLALLLLYALWARHATRLAPPPTCPPRTAGIVLALCALEAFLQHTGPGRALAASAAAAPWPLLLAAALLALCAAAARRPPASEGLLVLRGLGVQTTEGAGTYVLGRAATRFIPTEKIQDVLVNEVFCGFEVRYHLVVAVEGEDELVVVFPGLRPPRRIVETVWRGVRECLYEDKARLGSTY